MSAPCKACGSTRMMFGDTTLCDKCQPMVCVCPLPDPDAIGQCRRCARVYRPGHEGLMRARTEQMTYLMGRGVAL